MALQYSPKIVTDSLVMCLDASNNKSYPTDLPVKNGLALWLDAADDTTFSYSSGTVVSQWRDKSGNNFHANQSTTAQQPSRNTINNSRKSVFFNAASRLDYMTISSGISLPTDTSIFIVYKPSSQIYEYAVLIDNYHGQGGNYGFVIQRVSTNAQFYYVNGDGSSFVGTSDSPWTYTNNVIQLLSLNKSSSTGTPYISGTAQTSRTVYANTAQYTTGLAIGTMGLGGRFYNGDMCEILIFNRALSSTEMKQVHTYLGQKWGISNTDRSIVDLAGNDDNGLFGNGTVDNMPLYDYYNKGAFKFNSDNNNYIKVGTNSSLQLNTLTISAFFKTINNAQSVQFIGGFGNTGAFGYFLAMANSPIMFSVGNGTTGNQLSSGITPNNDQIYHVVGTYDGVTQKIYVDGVLKNSATVVTGNLSYSGLTDGFLLGQAQSLDAGRYMSGNIYAMQIYNKALSAAEVLQNYEAQKSKFANTIVQQGLVLNLDAGNPYSYAGAGTTWYDVSGNSYNGTLTNGPVYNTTNGGVIVFDGSDDYVSIPSNSNFNNGNNITVEAWVLCTNWSTYTHPMIVAKGINVEWILWKSNDTGVVGKLGWRAGGQAYTTTSLPNNTWVQCVGSVGGAGTKVYLNGVLESTVGNTIFTSGNVDVAIAAGLVAGSLSNPLGASVAITRIYNRQLTDAEVLQNYNATKGRFGL